jgi:hypothetical protein
VTTAEETSRWSRRFVLAGAAFLLLWQLGALVGVARPTAVALGVLGFVFHTIFGKAYALVPTYFDRELATVRFLPVHFACSVGGTLSLAIGSALAVPTAALAGSALWSLAVVLFVATLGWSIRGNLTGRATGTGSANAERQDVDRVANAAVPIALAYLAVGTYALLAIHAPVPTLLDGYPPRSSHLLTAGAGALLLFAVGFRLLPRFLSASPPRLLVATVLPAGAVGPALLALSLPAGPWFRVGATVEALAVVGYAAAVLALIARSDRRRVGFYGVLAGAIAGALAVALGLAFAFGRATPALVGAHFRLNVLGLLGLTIVGASYQFYPPAVGTFHGASDRTAVLVIAVLAVGLGAQVAGALAGAPTVVTAGQLCAAVGAFIHVRLLVGLFRERYG